MKNRYPGAGPFQDDALSRRVFFGRDKESSLLATRVQVYRVTVVYGRSGLGKSSLLNAGVTPIMRDNGFLPVVVRLNSIEDSLTRTIADHVEAEAARQQVEYVAGTTSTPWEYFKSSEIWKADELQIPVIIFDQFEEVFAINDDEKRDRIIEEVGLIVRGKPSTSDDGELRELAEQYGNSAPRLQVVLSIREDYLGFLEEMADDIPQIFDSRFRVTQLDRNSAREALEKPSHVVGQGFDSEPFHIHPDLSENVLTYLESDMASSLRRKRGVEPFQLQLICKHIEDISVRKQNSGRSDVTVTYADIGGEKGIGRALTDFYTNAVKQLHTWRERRKVRKLCAGHMISVDGKRQSIEQDTLVHQLGIPLQTLKKLVESRLFRLETRANTRYYELSHDTLVQPVLQSQGLSSRYVMSSKLIFQLLMLIGFFQLSLVFLALAVMSFQEGKMDDAVLAGILVILALAIMRPLFSRTKLSYKMHSRLKRVQLSREGAHLSKDSAKQGRYGKLKGLALVLLGFTVAFVGAALAGYFFDEGYTDNDFTGYSCLIYILGFLGVAQYGLILVRNGIRRIFEVSLAFTKPTELSRKPVHFGLRLLRWVFKVLIVCLVGAILATCLSILDCSGESFGRFHDLLHLLRLSDVKNVCAFAGSKDSSASDDFAGLLIMTLISAWGLILLHVAIRRRLESIDRLR